MSSEALVVWALKATCQQSKIWISNSKDKVDWLETLPLQLWLWQCHHHSHSPNQMSHLRYMPHRQSQTGFHASACCFSFAETLDVTLSHWGLVMLRWFLASVRCSGFIDFALINSSLQQKSIEDENYWPGWTKLDNAIDTSSSLLLYQTISDASFSVPSCRKAHWSVAVETLGSDHQVTIRSYVHCELPPNITTCSRTCKSADRP